MSNQEKALQFKIEQVALCPPDPVKAIELLKAMGLTQWATDLVTAFGYVGRRTDGVKRNVGSLAFNYEGFTEKRELEVLHYIEGDNWMESRPHSVSHLGMHCTHEELAAWRKFFESRDISVAQEVITYEHTNPVIAGKRWYQYVIFDTREILGVDIKFIVRRNAEGA